MDIKLDIDNPAQDEQTQPKVGDNKADDNELTELVDLSLFRLTYGLPRRELRLIVQEATECEAFLLDDIRMLELALQSDPIDGEGDNIGDSTTLSFVLDSLLTPLDRYWTASALLGRLRSDLCLPSLLTAKRGDTNHSKPQARHMHMTSIQDEKAFIELQTSMNALAKSFYRDTIPAATLLTVWKKISSNRAAAVFKKPVRTEDAPGYAERILFPMELSLIRKRIVTNQIQTFSDLHAALGLISYNCVKYNGE